MGKKTLLEKLRWDKVKHRYIWSLPDDELALLPKVYEKNQSSKPFDFILRAVFTLEEFKEVIHETYDKNLLNNNCSIYIIYPKKNNKKYEKYIGRDDIFPFLEVSEETGFVKGTDLKFNQMFAFNETFTCIGIKKIEKK